MIEFYYPEYIINDTSVIKDVLLSFFSSVFAFAIAYFIAEKSFKKHMKFEGIKQINDYKERLKYFTLLIENALSNTKDNINNAESIATEILNTPAELHFLIKKASADIDRLYKQNSDNVFKAYINLINNHDEKIKDFKRIFYAIDFIYLRIEMLFNSNEKHIDFLHRDQLHIQQKTDELENELIKYIKEYEVSVPNYLTNEEYLFFTRNHRRYVELTEQEESLTNIIGLFVSVFGREIREHHSQKPYFTTFYNLVSTIIRRYNHIVLNSTNFANELNDIRGELDNSINQLDLINNKIKKML